MDTVIFNPISSTILKWLRLKLLVGGMIFNFAQPMVWGCLIVGILLLGLFDC
jgi:hypothetical protein